MIFYPGGSAPEYRPATAAEAKILLDQHYHDGLAANLFRPIIYPLDTIAPALVMLYVLISWERFPFLRRLRFLVMFLFYLNTVHHLLCVRSPRQASAMVSGIISVWLCVWFTSLIILNDPQRDLQRVERRSAKGASEHQAVSQNGCSGHASALVSQNATIERKPTAQNGNEAIATTKDQYYWQGYPESSFRDRLDWASDLFSNFRGVSWNFSIPNLPTLPSSVQEQLSPASNGTSSRIDVKRSRGGTSRYDTYAELMRHNLTSFLFCYLIFDALKTAAMHDPFFFAPPPHAAPNYLPTFVRDSPLLLRAIRQYIGLGGMVTGLHVVMVLSPLVLGGILGRAVLGLRGEPWQYPEVWGSFRSVLDKGLAGWWGSWWHQTFRYGFEAPGASLTARLGLDKRSPMAKFLQITTAFTLSALLHAGGSCTQLGPTRPMQASFMFFFLQIPGVLIQSWLCAFLRGTSLFGKAPVWLRRMGNLLYVQAWFYLTASLLLSDFATGGIFLFEPLPVSIFRGLGFGAEKGGGWWQWNMHWFGWYRGRHWWESGIML